MHIQIVGNPLRLGQSIRIGSYRGRPADVESSYRCPRLEEGLDAERSDRSHQPRRLHPGTSEAHSSDRRRLTPGRSVGGGIAGHAISLSLDDGPSAQPALYEPNKT